MIGAIVGHLVGDYLLQNDFMASNKKEDSIICLLHCSIWTASVMLFGGFPYPSVMTGFLVMVVLCTTHFIQDRTNVIRRWMTLVGQDRFASGPLSPWSIVVVDNVWHIVTIWCVWTAFGIEGH